MKLFFYLPVILCLSCSAFAQEVVSLSIQKASENMDQKAKTSLEIYIPVNAANIDINNPIGSEKTQIEVLKDNTGHDLLQENKEALVALKEEGYTISTYDLAVQFNGIASRGSNPGILVRIDAEAAPASGAQELITKGELVLNFIDEGEPQTAMIKGIPVEMAYNHPGEPSAIGPIKIESAGSVSFNELTYHMFTVVGLDAPVQSATVKDGDDSQTIRDMGIAVDGNQLVFQEIPETVDLEVAYSQHKQEKVPLDLRVSVGL